MRLPSTSIDSGEPVVLRFSPEADCEAVAAARSAAAAQSAAVARSAGVQPDPRPGPASGAPAVKGSTVKGSTVTGSVLSPFHAAVALPANVSTYKHAKPPMPLSAAIAARADLAHVADALGHECLTESHLHSS